MVRFTRTWVAVAVGLFLFVSAVFAENDAAVRNKFQKRTHTYLRTRLPYRLFIPAPYESNKSYPLVLALHGAGERGSDNELQLSANKLATIWADSSRQAKWPCFVVAPQCPADQQWVDADWSKGTYAIEQVPFSNELATVSNLLDSLNKEFSLDLNRIYVTGISMGGYGTWDLITRYPRRFAAAIPMCGGADTSRAASIRHMPVWNFHGTLDRTVPVKASRDMISAMEKTNRACVYTARDFRSTGPTRIMPDSLIAQKVGFGALMLYTELPDRDHAIWQGTYENPLLQAWMFSQRKTVEETVPQHAPQVDAMEIAFNYPNPFNPSTTIEYTLKKSTLVMIDILNLAGQKIAQITHEKQNAGTHHVTFNAKDLPSGNYFFRIITPEWVQHGNMVLLK